MPDANQINDLRKRILEGDEPSREELRAAIQSLVGDRIAEHTTPAKTKKTPSVKVDLGDLL